ncbi:GntR family transcriptional regulator [Sporosarcina sp. G11-34]|uniref:GntR family transcriptional regulator n=1 Tax=Sporosarcina sp. G11-34 TaxID=2849605 RepID=UPI0022A9478F|nr:GntR family transcriptional regulator [Sporosarcina sp. G11-34]MCZ2257697.1 GntR family transcriptional regulator [Sporosarcina sp. G11-34]
MINSDLHIPLHIQISRILEKKIKEGIYKEKIPSERDLMDQFSVSRTTIREAVLRLVNLGTLKKIHGKGTFITKIPPIQQWLSSLNSFTETVQNMGMEPGSKLLKKGKVNKEHCSNNLIENDMYSIERLRFANKKPIAIEQHYYSLDLGLNLSKYDLESATIFELLENELGINLIEAEQFISTEIVDERSAYLLDVPLNTSVFSVERIIYDETETPVEYYKGLYRPDMYVFRIKAKRGFS